MRHASSIVSFLSSYARDAPSNVFNLLIVVGIVVQYWLHVSWKKVKNVTG